MKKLLCIIVLLLCLTANVGQAQFVSTGTFGELLNFGHWSTDGLVFYWRGIEAGEVVDESFFRNHGVITGATWVGEGLLFDAIGEGVDIPHNGIFVSSPDITVFMVVKKLSTSVGFTNIWGINKFGTTASGDLNAWTLHLTEGGSDDHFAFTVRIAGSELVIASATDLPLNVWVTIAGVRSGGDMIIYRNGVQDNISTGNSTAAISDGANYDVHIGRSHTNTLTPDILVATAGFYNRALSASEILDLYINPDLPMQQDPIWLLFSPPTGIVFRPKISYGIGQGIGR